jgi:hypothetical protein
VRDTSCPRRKAPLRPPTADAVCVIASFPDEPLEPGDVDPTIAGEAGGGKRRNAGRAEDVVCGAVGGLERRLRGKSASEDVLVALEPGI